MNRAESTSSLLISIQLLRAFAALSVVVGHTITEIHQTGTPYLEMPVNFGIGVDIFFVVSGFVMFLTGKKLAGRRGAALEFMRRRVIRVVPLYWLYTFAMLFAIWQFPDQLNHSSTSLSNVTCSFLFLPCLNGEGDYRPVLALGWTLNYEMFFYLLFAIALALRPAGLWFYHLWGLMVLFLLAGQFLGGPFHFWGNPIVLEFLVGGLIAVVYQRLGPTPSKAGLALSALTAGALYFALEGATDSRFITLGLPAIILVAGLVFALPRSWERRSTGFARYVGDSSYSLYLCHPFALAIVKIAWDRFDQAHSFPTAYFITAVGASLAGARLSFIFIERPLTDWLNRKHSVGRLA